MFRSKAELVKAAMEKIGNPQILVNMVSRRVRLLGHGDRPLVEVHPKMTFMDVVLTEIAEGKLSWEAIGEKEENVDEVLERYVAPSAPAPVEEEVQA